MRQRKAARRKRRGLSLAVPFLVFLLGAGIFFYPAVSNLLAESRQADVIQTYEAMVGEEEEEKLELSWENARIYNENLAGDPAHDPFISDSGYVLPDNYMEILNPAGDGVMGTLEIPKIGGNFPIYHGTDEEVLKQGVGHLEMTSLPVGGESRHSVLCAHRGLPSAELFTRLDEMEEGDVFYVHVLDEVHAYQVDEIHVIQPEEIDQLRVEEGEDLVTLMTCTPYGVNSHRLLVRGKRIPYVEQEAEAQRKAEKGGWKKLYAVGTAAGAVVLLLALVGASAAGRRRKRRKKRRSRG